MAVARETMTDEQRKSVALEYLKAFDNGGVTSTGDSILSLFASDAQVWFPKWGLANGHDQIGKLFGDVGGTIKSIVHDYSHFNWIMTGTDTFACEGTSHGVHRDGQWRAGVEEWKGRSLVRRVRGPRLADPALLHLSRPRLRRRGHRPLPLAQLIAGVATAGCSTGRAAHPPRRSQLDVEREQRQAARSSLVRAPFDDERHRRVLGPPPPQRARGRVRPFATGTRPRCRHPSLATWDGAGAGWPTRGRIVPSMRACPGNQRRQGNAVVSPRRVDKAVLRQPRCLLTLGGEPCTVGQRIGPAIDDDRVRAVVAPWSGCRPRRTHAQWCHGKRTPHTCRPKESE